MNNANGTSSLNNAISVKSSEVVKTTPAQIALNMLLYTMYSLAGTLIYYPSLLINLPESTLERSLPKTDLCKRMGMAEPTCKKKIKCLIKKCSFIEDPIGYKLDKLYSKTCKKGRRLRNISSGDMVGGSRKNNKMKTSNWRNHLSKKLKSELTDAYVSNVEHYINGNRRYRKRYSMKNQKLRRLSKRGGSMLATTAKKFANKAKSARKTLVNTAKRGKEHLVNTAKRGKENLVNEAKKSLLSSITISGNSLDKITCKNKHNKSLCDLNEKVEYKQEQSKLSDSIRKHKKLLLPFFVGGGDIDSPPVTESKQVIRDFMIEKLKPHVIFKLTIIIKTLEMMFKDQPITEDEIASINPNFDEDVSPIFPWKSKDPSISIEDRIKCMSAHLSSTSIDREQNPDLYDKCFICKHCTLRNTAGKIWGQVLRKMFTGDKTTQFIETINAIYGLLRPHINFSSYMNPKQYYLTSLISLLICNDKLKLNFLNTKFEMYGAEYDLRDLIAGIPQPTVNERDLKDDYHRLRSYYVMFYKMGLTDDLSSIYYESILRRYFRIPYINKDERLYYLKNIVYTNYKLLYDTHVDKSRKSQYGDGRGVLYKIYNNNIHFDDLKGYAHFENNDKELINLLKNKNYPELNKVLYDKTYLQYVFLLNNANFHTVTEPHQVSEHEMKQIQNFQPKYQIMLYSNNEVYKYKKIKEHLLGINMKLLGTIAN